MRKCESHGFCGGRVKSEAEYTGEVKTQIPTDGMALKRYSDLLQTCKTSSSSNWILMSCQPRRVTSGQSNSGHKQIHISKLFSYIYQVSP